MIDNLKLENQLCFPLYAASRKVISAYTPFLKPLDLTYTQYLIMLVLCEEDGRTIGDICRLLHLDNGTVTPTIKKIIDKGLINRKRNEDDDRVVEIFLTTKGKEFEKRACEIPDKVICNLGLKNINTKELYNILYEIINFEPSKEK